MSSIPSVSGASFIPSESPVTIDTDSPQLSNTDRIINNLVRLNSMGINYLENDLDKMTLLQPVGVGVAVVVGGAVIVGVMSVSLLKMIKKISAMIENNNPLKNNMPPQMSHSVTNTAQVRNLQINASQVPTAQLLMMQGYQQDILKKVQENTDQSNQIFLATNPMPIVTGTPPAYETKKLESFLAKEKENWEKLIDFIQTSAHKDKLTNQLEAAQSFLKQFAAQQNKIMLEIETIQ